MDAHEAHETAEKSLEGGHHNDPFAKRCALLIVMLAAALAIGELGAKSSQNHYTAANIEASNLWSFYQAKNNRQTVLETAADVASALSADVPPERKAVLDKLSGDWRAKAQRYESDPASNEGKKELAKRAADKEHERDLALERYHHFEFGGAAFELAIVLASAATITGVARLALVSAGFGILGAILALFGWLSPTLL